MSPDRGRGNTLADAITVWSSSPGSMSGNISSSSSRSSVEFEWNKVKSISRHALDKNDNDAPIIEVQLADGAKWVTLELAVLSKDMKFLKLLLEFSRSNGNLQLFVNEPKWEVFFPKFKLALANAILDDGGATESELAKALDDEGGSTGTTSNYSSNLI
jgi:hypothetical protein